MKKLLLVFTVCAFFVACNNGSTSKENTIDTTNTTVDTTTAPVTTDTTSAADTTMKMNADTTKAK